MAAFCTTFQNLVMEVDCIKRGGKLKEVNWPTGLIRVCSRNIEDILWMFHLFVLVFLESC